MVQIRTGSDNEGDVGYSQGSESINMTEGDQMTLQELIREETELTSLPEIFIRIWGLLEDENANATQIGRVVETDPALSMRILKMVNSAFYGFRREISSIPQSITILGRSRLRQILIGVVLGGMFGKMKSDLKFMEHYWHHSVKTAILARHLGNQSKQIEEAEVMFTAGLLHQIGRLVLAQLRPAESKEIEHLMEVKGMELFQAEQQILGFNHREVGAGFIEKWGLPDLLVEVTGNLGNPENAGDYVAETRMLALANGLSMLIEPIMSEEVEMVLQDIPGWELNQLTLQQITAACTEANEQIDDVMDSLGMLSMKIQLDDE